MLPSDEGSYSHIIVQKEKSSLILRYSSLSTMHADIAQIFALQELDVTYEVIDKSNFLHKPINGFSVVGAGEFRLIGKTFYHRPASSSYNGLCVPELIKLLKPKGYNVEMVEKL